MTNIFGCIATIMNYNRGTVGSIAFQGKLMYIYGVIKCRGKDLYSAGMRSQ